jgi:hypothetical protein
MSESDDDDIGIVVSLERILKDLKDAQAQVTKVIASERRARRQDDSVAGTLRTIHLKLVALNEELGEVSKPVVMKNPRQANKKRGRVVVDNEDVGNDDDSSGSGGEKEKSTEKEKEELFPKEQNKRVACPVVVVARAKSIGDGMAGRLAGDLVYFSLSHKRDKKLWICPSRTMEGLVGSLIVERNHLQHVQFEALSIDERVWYLSQLESDILQRFRVNFAVLFSRIGCDMIDARTSLINDSSARVCASLIDSLADHVETQRLSTKTSPALSAINNTALMIVATMHRELSVSGDPNWRDSFVSQVGSLCKRCDLAFSTLERYRKVGDLMLRCNVLACLLPSFLALLEAPITSLVANKESFERFDDAFRELVNDYMKSFDVGDFSEKRGELLGEKPGEKLGEHYEQNAKSMGEHMAKKDGEINRDGVGIIEDLEEWGNDVAMEKHQEKLVAPSKISVYVQVENHVEKRVEKLRLCRKCKSMIASYTCDTNSHNFCWKCDGYDNAPPDELLYPNTDVSIHTYIFCEKHLNGIESCQYAFEHYLKTPKLENALTLANFVSYIQAEEARQLVSIFSRNDCQFSITPIESNGWCIFKSIAVGVHDTLERFILELQRFVDEYVNGKGDFMNEVAQFVYLWKNLDPNNNDTVQELWACDDGDLLLPMFAEYLNRDSADAARIVVWKIVKGVLERQPLEYPSNEGQFEQTIDLLQTNLIVPHYDLLQRIVQ